MEVKFLPKDAERYTQLVQRLWKCTEAKTTEKAMLITKRKTDTKDEGEAEIGRTRTGSVEINKGLKRRKRT